MKDEINTIAGEIEQEVRRAVQLHRGICSLHEAKAIIEEELDEFWDEVKVNPKKLSEVDREKRIANLRMELIQVAAMCVRSISDLGLLRP